MAEEKLSTKYENAQLISCQKDKMCKSNKMAIKTTIFTYLTFV
jgi:hypothetical protein